MPWDGHSCMKCDVLMPYHAPDCPYYDPQDEAERRLDEAERRLDEADDAFVDAIMEDEDQLKNVVARAALCDEALGHLEAALKMVGGYGVDQPDGSQKFCEFTGIAEARAFLAKHKEAGQ